jgi:hypothetical protein
VTAINHGPGPTGTRATVYTFTPRPRTADEEDDQPPPAGQLIRMADHADSQPDPARSPSDLDAEIEKWVAVHLANSPVWDEERWAGLGDLLGVDFIARSA